MPALGKAAVAILERVMPELEGGSLSVRLPDGSTRRFGSGPEVRIDIRNSRFFRRLATRAKLALGESYYGGRVGLRRPGRVLRAAAPERRVGARAASAPAPLPRGAPAREPPNRLHAGAAEHRIPLRPRQRPLRALPGRDDDVLLRDLRARRRAARGCPAAQAPPRLREARARPRRSRARDRLRLGELRDRRGRRVRRARHRDHHLAGAGRDGAGADRRRRPRRPGPRARAGLPHGRGPVHEDRVDRDARGDRGEAVRDLSSPPATGCSRPAGARASRRSSSPTRATTATGRHRTGSSATSSRAASFPRSAR